MLERIDNSASIHWLSACKRQSSLQQVDSIATSVEVDHVHLLVTIVQIAIIPERPTAAIFSSWFPRLDIFECIHHDVAPKAVKNKVMIQRKTRRWKVDDSLLFGDILLNVLIDKEVNRRLSLWSRLFTVKKWMDRNVLHGRICDRCSYNEGGFAWGFAKCAKMMRSWTLKLKL